MFIQTTLASVFALLGPNAQQSLLIAKNAGGLLPKVPFPTKLGPGSKTTFQLIAFNELFEVAFFDSLLQNVTRGVEGYKINAHVEKITKILTTVRAPEEQHAIAADAALTTAGEFSPAACQYSCHVSDLASAISLAETFTAWSRAHYKVPTSSSPKKT